MALEIELKGSLYSIGRMSVMRQLHVSRRVALILPPLINVYMQMSGSQKPLTESMQEMASSLQPFIDGLASMKDEDVEYIMSSCLAVVQRKQDGGWANVWSASAGRAMFDDLDLGVLLELVARVISDNLGPFILGLLTSQQGGPQATQAG